MDYGVPTIGPLDALALSAQRESSSLVWALFQTCRMGFGRFYVAAIAKPQASSTQDTRCDASISDAGTAARSSSLHTAPRRNRVARF
jgi:hypothetical protein